MQEALPALRDRPGLQNLHIRDLVFQQLTRRALHPLLQNASLKQFVNTSVKSCKLTNCHCWEAKLTDKIQKSAVSRLATNDSESEGQS